MSNNELKELRAIGERILFRFVEDTEEGKFSNKTLNSGLIVVNKVNEQLEVPRWGVVLGAGSRVGDGIKKGDYILIEPLAWTNRLRYEGASMWATNYEKVMAVSIVEPEIGYQ